MKLIKNIVEPAHKRFSDFLKMIKDMGKTKEMNRKKLDYEGGGKEINHVSRRDDDISKIINKEEK